jgi:hypothetical protein
MVIPVGLQIQMGGLLRPQPKAPQKMVRCSILVVFFWIMHGQGMF